MSTHQVLNAPNSVPSRTQTKKDGLPHYNELHSTSNGDRQPVHSEQLFEENEFGEITPVKRDDDAVSTQEEHSPYDTGFLDNGHGKTHRGREDGPADDAYAENRFGELGRADTFYPDDHSHLSDKIKGTAEQMIGKLTHNKDLHDKGILRKSHSPAR